jgi:sugar lactone lactonase YvrE
MLHSLGRRCVLLLVVFFVLAACANPFAAAPQPEQPTATPEPTAQPTATPLALEERLRVEQGGYSLNYPTGWETRVISSTLAMARTGQAIDARTPGEELVVLVDSMPLARLAEQHSADDVATLDSLFELSSTDFARAGYTIGATEPITIDGQSGLSANLSGDGGGGQLIVLRIPPQRVRVVGQAAPEAWEEQQALFEEIVASLEFFAPVEPATPTPVNQATQPEIVTEGPPGFVLRLGSNEGSLASRFVSARGLATAPDGTLYVAESSRGIWVFETDGTLRSTFGEDDLNDAYDVAIGAGGDLFVADYGSNSIVRFTSDGTLVERWGTVGEGEDQFGLLSPQRIAVGPENSIYALDNRVDVTGSSSSVLRFNGEDGSFIERIPMPPGSSPNDLAVDRAGSIYLAETVNGTIVKVSPQGEIQARYGENVVSEGITAGAIDLDSRDNIYIGTWNNGIMKFAPDGSLLATAGSIAAPGTIPAPGEFTLPNGIAAAPGEVVWVSDNNGEYSAITALRLVTDAEVQATADAVATAEATPPPEELLMSQWASAATASSSYDDEYAPDGITGPPDVEGCRSSPNAWASAAPDSQETIEVSFDEPVYATKLSVFQNHQPGSITRIDVGDVQGNATTVYTGTAELLDTCPFTLIVDFGPTLAPIVSATLMLDQSNGTTWNEIDAVELVGLP